MGTEKMGIGDHVIAVLGKAMHKDWSRTRTEKARIIDRVRAVVNGFLVGIGMPKDKVWLRVNVHVVHKRMMPAVGAGLPYEVVLADYWGENLVTDRGDEHITGRVIEGDTEDIITGMKLGNDSATAVAKNGAGAAMVSYISGSNEALDASPTDATKGAGAGWRATFVCTWIAGDVTDADIEEVCLTNQTALADNTSAEADTIARFIFGSPIDKQAGDSLEVTWQVDVQGA
jgi:hypothetical protein